MRHVGLVVVLASVLVGSVFLWPASAHVTHVSSDGDKVRIVNGRNGLPIFTIADMAPGDTGTAEVTLSNDGLLPASLVLTTTSVADVPGTNGGRLSDALHVRIEDVTDAPGAVVFDGRFLQGEHVTLHSIAPKGARTFRFTVSLPDGGRPAGRTSGDNAFQGARVQIDYTWTASGRDEDADPQPQPQPQPTGAAAASGEPPVLVVPVGSAPSSQRAARECLSRRDFTIRLREPRGSHLRSARVVVDGRRLAVRRVRGRLTARVDLRGMRKALVRVHVVARTRGGRRLVGTRTYSTCTHKMVGTRAPRL